MIKKISIILILVLAFFLRFWKLDSYPALNADEAAIGYNTYSLIQTGKDEHGNPWPIHFQSFNDYKPGGYFYMVLPFVKFFGLNEWSVRIPNAILSVITVYLTYLLALKLLYRNKFINGKFVATASALMLAISPWHIHFSRGGWEVNVATFFITLGSLLFLKYIDEGKNKFLPLSLLSFALSLYTYHSARLIAPLLGVGLVAIYWNKIFSKNNFKFLLFNFIFLLLILVPLGKELMGPAGISRAAGVGLLADPGPINRVNEQRGEHDNFGGIASKLVHNKFVNYSLAFLDNYTKHFHGLFLFLSGDDIQRNKVPETGQMYMLDVLWFIFGLWWMIKNLQEKEPQFIGLWLLIAPVAAALTFQSPHALRSENMVIPLVLICGIGLNVFVNAVKNFSKGRSLRSAIYLIVTLLVSLQFGRYLHMYWYHMSKEYPFSSQYGVKELVSYLNSGAGDKYQNYVVTDRYDQPYILFLFYTKYDPAKFQTDHTLTPRDQFGFSTVRKFDKYVFISITNWDSLRSEYKNSLVVGTDEEIFPGTNVVKEIYGTNGYKYFQVIAN